jgi:hypothetical protein
LSSIPDQLLEYRVCKLEEAVAVLSAGFTEIADTVRGAKWAVLIIFGFIQPVGIGMAIHFLSTT